MQHNSTLRMIFAILDGYISWLFIVCILSLSAIATAILILLFSFFLLLSIQNEFLYDKIS